MILPLAVAAAFAPIAAFGAAGIYMAVFIALIAFGILFRFLFAPVFIGLLLLCLAMPFITFQRAGSVRHGPTCLSNLSQIGFALHGYHQFYGCFPPAYIADKNGKPMHSWRVLLLPWLDSAAMYRQYRFDEPWDGPNNRKLGGSRPDCYHCPKDSVGPYCMANYVAVVGAGTAWPGSASTKLSEFSDGAEQTIMVVEMENSGIPWMEPRDLDFSKMPLKINAKGGQGISSQHARDAELRFADGRLRFVKRACGANVLFADGHVAFLADSISPEVLRALLTIHGGERLEESSDDWQFCDPRK
jgi:prepilin-type processing-associated H-X9-DG protein